MYYKLISFLHDVNMNRSFLSTPKPISDLSPNPIDLRFGEINKKNKLLMIITYYFLKCVCTCACVFFSYLQ